MQSLFFFLLLLAWLGVAVHAAVSIRPFSLPDEAAHYLRAYEVSRGHWLNTVGNVGVMMPCEEYQRVGTANGSIYRYIDVAPMLADTGRQAPCEVTSSNTAGTYSPLLYLFSAVGFKVADKVQPDYRGRHDYGRIANAIGNTLVVFLGLSLLTRLRPLFAVIACIPMAVWLRSSLSADAVAGSLCFLFVCLLARSVESRSSLAMRDLLWFCIAGALVGATKPLYSVLPFAALVFWRAGPLSTPLHLWRACLLLPGLASVLVAMLLTRSADSSLVVLAWGAVPGDQVLHVLFHPFHAIGTMLNTLFINGEQWLNQLMGSMNIAVNVEIYLVPILLLMAMARSTLSAWQRLFVFLLGMALCAETMMALYVTFSPVGHSEIYGVQGRQFLPAVLLLAWPLSMSLSDRISYGLVIEKTVGYCVPLLFVCYCLAYKMQIMGY